MSATLEAITLENQRHGQRITITADGSTTFDTTPEGWVPSRLLDVRNTTRRLPTITSRQIEAMAFQLERMGWKEIGLAYHGLPDAGIVQR